jgi:hypothetical protein
MWWGVVVSVAHCAGVCSAVGAHGWNINESNLFGMAFTVVSWCQYGGHGLCALFWGVWGVVVGNALGRGVCGVVFGALLGPEATGPFCSNAGGHFWCFFCSCFRFRYRMVCVVVVWLMGLLFENYIVDASI